MTFFSFLILILSFQFSYAKIVKTDQIQDVQSEITPNSLVLFNIAEVLLDTETSLGTQKWRKYVRAKTPSVVHDKVTLLVFEKMPPKAVDKTTPKLIKDLQNKDIVVLGFTSRGRNEWYNSKIANVDLLTESILKKVGIDFSRTYLPKNLQISPEYFHEGIIYTTNAVDKGELLENIFSKTEYRPEKVIFVDDKEDSLREVQAGLEKLNISFVGYCYTKTAKDHKDFDPMIANIQLFYLIKENKILTDEEAKKLKISQYLNVTEEKLFSEIPLNF